MRDTARRTPPHGRGRRPKEPTTVLNLRISNSIYDRYICCARRSRIPVRTLLRRVLTLHAPPPALVATTGSAHETTGQQPFKW